jgi:hypothetical protein
MYVKKNYQFFNSLFLSQKDLFEIAKFNESIGEALSYYSKVLETLYFRLKIEKD